MTKLERAMLNAKKSLSKYSKDIWDIEDLTERIYQLLDVIVDLTDLEENKRDEFVPEQFGYELIQGKIMYSITSGRWTIGYLELASNTIFEILINDEWVKVKMEYDGDKYYLTVPEINISEGIKGRIRPADFKKKTD